MQQTARSILTLGLCMGAVSVIYFLALVMQMPVWLIVVVMAIALAGIVMYARPWNVEEAPGRSVMMRVLIIAIALGWLGSNMAFVATRHGGWDAWALWNYHAQMLSDGQHWKLLFADHNGHPDYPLLLPAFNAFFIRLGGTVVTVPLFTAILFTFCIVVLIYSQLATRNRVAAIVVLCLLATDTSLAQFGVSEYADTTLAFFFLAAIISKEYAQADRRYLAIAAAMAAFCFWTKNEGVLLGVLFLAFNGRIFFRRHHLRYFLVGIAVPLIVWAVFKMVYAPPNDLVSRADGNTLLQARDWNRYVAIYRHFTDNLNTHFHYCKILFWLWLIIMLLRRRMPSRNTIMVLVALAGYMGIYVFTHMDLEWHLITSQGRLMHQLMPAFVYVSVVDILGDLRMVSYRFVS